jgi:hypothetical protein
VLFRIDLVEIAEKKYDSGKRREQRTGIGRSTPEMMGGYRVDMPATQQTHPEKFRSL